MRFGGSPYVTDVEVEHHAAVLNGESASLESRRAQRRVGVPGVARHATRVLVGSRLAVRRASRRWRRLGPRRT